MKKLLYIIILTSIFSCKNDAKFYEGKKLAEFPKTTFIPTLENKIAVDKNSVYCATLLFAWDEIRKMFIRIVKMCFQEDKIEAFLKNFEEVKQQIRNFEGNQFLELYQDKNDKRIFFTYSYWENETALENYRNSTLFNEVWSYTKTLFSDKPEAWSVNRLVTLS